MSASGKFGGTMVFAVNKGRNIVRQLVIPSNPKTVLQLQVRNKLSVAASIQKNINRTLTINAALMVRDEVALRNRAPSGETWNAGVTREVVGTGGAKYFAASTAYAAATAATWQAAALGLPTPYADIVLRDTDNMGTITVSAGEQFFRHQYALYTAGVLMTAPTVPPVYA